MRMVLMNGSLGHAMTWILLYVGPDLILPLTSALAAIAGVLLMFWNKVLGFVRAAWRLVFQRGKTPRA